MKKRYMIYLTGPIVMFIGIIILDMYYGNGIDWKGNLSFFLFYLVVTVLSIFLSEWLKKPPS